MKPLSTLQKLLLLSSMLISPSLAMAQTQPQPQPQPAEETYAEDEIVVLGRNIPEPMRETSEVATFLGAEDLARTGDSSAAEALTRLTGLSVVSGRFVFVRGLGDRYSSALLNGSPLPSPEPLRRTVPLDLFPSSILEGATIQKTFSPNYPGEFGGGIIDLRTVSIPREAFLNLKVGTGVNTETAARRGLIYNGSDSDWSSYDDGLRDLPAPLANAIGQNQLISDVNFSTADLEAIGESFVNSPLSVIQSQNDLWADGEVELSGGTSFNAGRFNIGLVGVGGYDSSWRTQRAQRGIGSTQGGIFTVGEDKESLTTAWDVTLNALASASIGWDESEVSLTGLYIHTSTKEAQQIVGYDFNLPGGTPDEQVGYRESTGWYERELAMLQLAGEHRFGDFGVDWRVAQAQSSRDAPYERSVNWLVDANGPFYGRANDNSTRFSALTDDVLSGGLDLSYTLAISDSRDIVFSAGYDYSNTERAYDALTFVFGGGSGLPDDVARARVDYLFSPDNIDPARFEIFELTGPDDSYRGELTTNAGYFAVDAEIFPLLRIAAGLRYEQGEQSVVTFNRYGAAATPAAAPLDNDYLLPAFTLTWNFAENMQFRAGASQTIARPQFRELALSPYTDPDTDRNYRGNPYLIDTELTNYDARLEYYFGQNQYVAGSLFYKEIENPIEEVVTEPSTFNFLVRFINAPRAVVQGAEIEFRSTFDLPFEIPGMAAASLFVAANYTYTQSEIEAGAGDTVINPLTGAPTPANVFGIDGAPMQGTPENIVNLQFGIEDDNTQLTLLVGWVDTRILQRGFGASGGLPDIVEDPGINVDLVFRHNFSFAGTDFTLGLSGRNMLGEEHREFQESDVGDLEVNTYDRGRSFSASLTTRF
jgi:outer membrane receptor protein involved in Fe transport